MIVNNYRYKKLVQYLKPGMKVCLKFLHGVGDTFMFYPVFKQLQRLYPYVKFNLYTDFGQEYYFGKCSCKQEDYDIVFVINFYCNQDQNPLIHTKVSLCCQRQLGITFNNNFQFSQKIQSKKSPIIGVHFNSTCNPNGMGCSQVFANQIWNSIIEYGYIPIQTHFIHCYHNPKNKKYDFVTNNVRNCKCSIDNLIGLLQVCSGFIGVGSGPFILASQMYPHKVLYLKNKNDIKCYYQSKQILSMDTKKQFDSQIFKRFIENVRNF